MGANFLILAASVFLPVSQRDTTNSTEQPSHGIGYERLSDALAYNRVQGFSFGAGYHHSVGRAGPTVFATVRYGLSDERVGGRLSILHEAGTGRIRLSGYSEPIDLDPISPGLTISNTVNAVFAGHDNADYAWGRGASLTWGTRVAPGLLLELDGRVEQRSSVARTAHSAVNDFLGGSGVFPLNPPIREGTFGVVSGSLRKLSRTRWSLTLDAVSGAGVSVGRLYGAVRRSVGAGPVLTIQLQAGASTEPGLPQTAFRLGGPNSVRGFEYGTRRGPAFWAAQTDLTLVRGRFRPILFADAGQTGRTGDLLSSRALVGAGAGLALLRGLIRFDLSRAITPEISRKLRFDLLLQGFW
jgi:hypothetical protein